MNTYTILGYIAMIVMPLAASINFGWQAYSGFISNHVPVSLATIGGVSVGIGLELLGAIAGHLAIKYYGQRDWNRTGISSAAIALYVLVGTVEMLTIPFARFIPLLAAVVYVLVGLQDDATSQDQAKAKEQRQSLIIQHRKEEAEAIRQHELEMEKLRLNAELKKEKLKAGGVSNMVSRKHEETGATKKETMARFWKPGMKPTELAELAGVSKGYASKYINNGAMNTWEQNAQEGGS